MADFTSLFLSPFLSWKEVITMEFLLTVISSVLAGVITYYLCKWIDRNLENRWSKKISHWMPPVAFLFHVEFHVTYGTCILTEYRSLFKSFILNNIFFWDLTVHTVFQKSNSSINKVSTSKQRNLKWPRKKRQGKDDSFLMAFLSKNRSWKDIIH